MNVRRQINALDGEGVSEVGIPKAHYVSAEFAEQEARALWPHVWQMACRAEEIARPGQYVVYEILDESIILVRREDGAIAAYHNVCPHRANQLVGKSGTAKGFVCSFHGWKWDLDGRNIHIKDAGDWAGCPGFSPDRFALKPVRTGEWGGFVFINLDPDAEPFETFIDPVPEYLDCLEFDKMNYVWSKSFPLKANWKVALESFMESYHVYTTHPQTVGFLDATSQSWERGWHGNHGYPEGRLVGLPSAHTDLPPPDDRRRSYVEAINRLAEQTGGVEVRVGAGSGRSADAVARILDEVGPDATIEEIHVAGMTFMREAAIAEGAGWPEISPEQGARLGVDWNIFPNMILVFSIDSTLVFRARPDGADPNKCLFDMWGLLRMSPEKVRPVTREYYESWQENADKIPPLLVQDLSNIERIQKGMRSSSFRRAVLNPVQERQIYNHHRVLKIYLDREE